MKKIIFTLAIILTMGTTFAEVDFDQVLKTTSMPTDSEIKAVISQFDFDEKTKQQLFKETKKKLQQMYSGADTNANAELNSSLDSLKNSSGNAFIDPKMKEEILKEADSLPQK